MNKRKRRSVRSVVTGADSSTIISEKELTKFYDEIEVESATSSPKYVPEFAEEDQDAIRMLDQNKLANIRSKYASSERIVSQSLIREPITFSSTTEKSIAEEITTKAIKKISIEGKTNTVKHSPILSSLIQYKLEPDYAQVRKRHRHRHGHSRRGRIR